MRASAVESAAGLIVGLFGVAVIFGGLCGLVARADPIGCVVAILVGLYCFVDGRRKYHRDAPKSRFRERVAELGDPTGKALREVRGILGPESDFEKAGSGARVVWRCCGLSLALDFDAGKVCTGTAAARGFGAMH